MKKIFLFIAILVTINVNSQTTQKQVEISKKILTIVNKIKANDYFNFIASPDKMFEIYDCKGTLDSYKVNGENYFIKIDTDNNIVVYFNNGQYHFNLVDNDLVGYGYSLDTRQRELTTYYFQNNKTVKKSTVSKT
ncbi:hypothetical protein R1T16_01425 [Flavobacterium sp. DG1-102-2]|uniref:hypothetical protein n=1 Tax=Flavobacterium sp. DG1-102-2 TaxID=3081663 RepID=UPI002949E294|nr:hypothetical protein [Flavobacterium sp. DG1-102-2]MDV6167065.1 hypothetical protein [Flavobacterium sp. DG1-102-2]